MFWMCKSSSSFEQTRLPSRFCPNSDLVKPKGFAMKEARFLALSFRRLQCHSDLRRVISLFLKMTRNSAKGGRCSSLASLCCFLRDFSSCRIL